MALLTRFKWKWTEEKLWELRKEIVLGSIYYHDYRNSFGVDSHKCCDFFDSYAEELGYIMEENEPNYSDEQFFDLIKKYDNSDNLWNWFYCYEWNPLPIKVQMDRYDLMKVRKTYERFKINTNHGICVLR